MSQKLFPTIWPDLATCVNSARCMRSVPAGQQPATSSDTATVRSARLVRTLPRARLGPSLATGLAAVAATIVDVAAQTPPPAVNVVALTMHRPRLGFNRMTISIDLCVPGTSHCITIDDVMVDTGSTGLRIEPGSLPPGFRLPGMAGAGTATLAECVRFVHDQAWGKVARADLHLGGLVAADLPVQLISADDEPHPSQCPASGVAPTSNATLGIGSLNDCPDPCDGTGPGASYFACADDGCRPIRAETPDRLPNPVARLPRHNTGVVFDLPSVPAAGSRAVIGTLTLGVDTTDNNRLDGMRLLRLDGSNQFTTVLFGRSYPLSSIDSGATSSIVPEHGLRRCEVPFWALCEAPPRRFEADMVGSDGDRIARSFQVGDFVALSRPGIGAAEGLAVAAPGSSRGVVWGAPLFLGKRVAFGFATPNRPAFFGFKDRR